MIVTSWERAVGRAIVRMAEGKVSLLSLDVFDTLLLRTTSPEFVVASSTRRVAALVGTDEETARRARERSWRIAASTSVAAGKCNDARMEDHFRIWLSLLAGDRLDREALAELARSAMVAEIDDEAAALVPNYAVRRLLETAESFGIEVVALSDMYMSAEQVSGLLHARGMGFRGRVVTSGDVGRMKRTGRLFEWLVESSGVQPSRILHVGDDVLADGQRPARLGIASIAVRDRSCMRGRFLGMSSDSVLAGRSDAAGFVAADAAARGSRRSSDADYETGRTGFGPVMAAFVHGLVETAAADGVTSLWFMAREGALLRRLYDDAASVLRVHAPPSAEFYVSRLATLRAGLTGFGVAEIAAAVANTPRPTYRKILAPLRLGSERTVELLEEIGLDPDAGYDPVGAASLLGSAGIRAAAERIGAEEREGFRRYLERAGFPVEGHVGVVDVGWGGQIQENVEKVLAAIGSAVRVTGYYLGTNAAAENRRRSGLVMRALLVDSERGDGAGRGAFSFVQPLELACRSPHGSVMGYAPDGMPVLADRSSPGRADEERDDPRLARMQTGIIAFCRSYFAHVAMMRCDAASSRAMGRFALDRLALVPSRRQALSLVSLNNVANLGMDEGLMIGGRVSILRPRKMLAVLRATLWQEGTSAVALPFLGPLAFAAMRAVRLGRHRGLRSSEAHRSGADGRAAYDSPSDVGLFDVEAERDRLAGPLGFHLSSQSALFGTVDVVAVTLVRWLAGASSGSDRNWWWERTKGALYPSIHKGIPAEMAKVALRRFRNA